MEYVFLCIVVAFAITHIYEKVRNPESFYAVNMRWREVLTIHSGRDSKSVRRRVIRSAILEGTIVIAALCFIVFSVSNDAKESHAVVSSQMRILWRIVSVLFVIIGIGIVLFKNQIDRYYRWLAKYQDPSAVGAPRNPRLVVVQGAILIAGGTVGALIAWS